MPTYPKDDNGNVRVDFVWGNFPLQPDELRDGNSSSSAPNDEGDRGWTGWYTQDSTTLSTSETVYLSRGDSNQDISWDDPNTRSVEVPTIHDIATEGYNNFPAFLPNYAGDGDDALDFFLPEINTLTSSAALTLLSGLGINFNYTTSFVGATVANDGNWKSQSIPTGAPVSANDTVNAVYFAAPLVPNVVDFDSLSAAQAHLELNGLVLGTTSSSTDGASPTNNGWIKSQSIASGTKVDAGTAVNLVTYNYVAPTNSGPISGFTRTGPFSVNGDEAVMYLVGRTVKPTTGDVINVAGSSNVYYNQNWNVMDVVNDDAYNSGGTAVLVQRTVFFDMNANPTSTGGTWTKI